MSVEHSHKWEPIEDLPADWSRSLAKPQTTSLVTAWIEHAAELREQNLYKNFLAKLQRQWAIETGAIEDLYTLSEAGTLTLIGKGLDASLLSHDDTNLSPDELILKIKDQHQAIQGLYQFISGQRPLGTSYIKELHHVLTAHQDTYIGRDTLGNLVMRDLPRGEWKLLPNNVEHPDGTRFEYCPPDHVAQEMENLIRMHEHHQLLAVPPDVEAAWLHHRFSQIHPFTDGNGRVARCLATLVLLKAYWLPLVITRTDRKAYIDALRAADKRDLSPLIDLFDRLQRKAIREAMSLSEDVRHEATEIKSILASVKARYERQKATQNQQIQKSYALCDSLQFSAAEYITQIAGEVNTTIESEGQGFNAFMYQATRFDKNRSHYHSFQIVECAKQLGYFANLRRYQAWAALGIVTEQRTEILFSFHGIGHEDYGILGCSAIAYTKEKTDSGQSMARAINPLTDEPFEFSYSEDEAAVQARFRRWLEYALVEGLDYWQKSI